MTHDGLKDMSFTQAERKEFTRHVDLLLGFWELRDEVPASLPVVFLLVAANPGIGPKEIIAKSQRFDHTVGSLEGPNVSYVLRILERDLELVRSERDPQDDRRKCYSLTIAGEKFLRRHKPR